MKKKVLGLMMAFLAATPVFVNAEGNAVKIGETPYATLKDAVEAVEVCAEETCETTTINVTADHETSGIVFPSGLDIVVELGGYTVSFLPPTVGSAGTETIDMQILKDSDVVFQNGKLVSSDSEDSKMFIQNYANLTIKDVEIVATNEENLYALSNNSGDVNIIGKTSIKAKRVAFDVCGYHAGGYPVGPKVIVNTTGTIEGTIEVTRDGGTATRELELVIENINHVGEMSIQEGLENNVTVEGGSYTDENAVEKLPVEEGSKVYEVETEEGETKYVVATEEELEELPIIEDSEAISKEDKKELLEELDEILTGVADEIKKLEAVENPSEEESEQLKMFQELEKAYTKLNSILNTKEIVSMNEIIYGSVLDNNFVVGSEQTELEKAVKVALDLPENLEKVKEGYTRKYSVIRLHFNQDNTIELKELDAVEKDGKVTFETDKFSTYILTYEDTLATSNPKTFDGISLYMIIASVSLIGLVALVGYAKKAKSC